MSVLFVRESGVFLDNRIAYLKTPPDERPGGREKNKGGIGKAFRHCMHNQQTRGLLVSIPCFYLAIMAFSGYYESIMSTSGMDAAAVTQALFLYPFPYAPVTLLSGFISDRIGRKKLSGIYSVIAFLAFIAFNVTAKLVVSPYLVGGLFGLAIGAY